MRVWGICRRLPPGADNGRWERILNMKFTKKRDYNGSVRKVWSDDKEVCFGVVGTVDDLLQEGIFEYADYSPETWAFIPAPGVLQKPWFGKTREAALVNLPKM